MWWKAGVRGSRKNELPGRGFLGKLWLLSGLGVGGGCRLGRFLLRLLLAVGLHFFDQLEGTLQLTREALFVEREPGQAFALLFKGEGLGDGFGARVVRRARLVQLVGSGDGERAVFRGADAVETPRGVGDGLDELALDRGRLLAGDMPRGRGELSTSEQR